MRTKPRWWMPTAHLSRWPTVNADAFRRLALLFGATVYALGLGLVVVHGGWILGVFVGLFGFLVTVALTFELER